MIRAAGPSQPRTPEVRGRDSLSIHRPQGQYRQTTVGHEQLSPSPGLGLPTVRGASGLIRFYKWPLFALSSYASREGREERVPSLDISGSQKTFIQAAFIFIP